MIEMKKLARLVALFALGGCQDGSSADAGIDLSVGTPCSGTLSGAVTETILGCKVTWDEKNGVADVGNDGNILVSNPSAIDDSDSFGFVFTVNGDARTGSFSFANVSGVSAGVNVFGDGGAVNYAASFFAAPMGPPNLGSLSASLTGSTLDFTTATEQQWIVHGSMTATLVARPPSTATDTVQMTLDF